MIHHGQKLLKNTARRVRCLLGFSTYLILAQNHKVHLILAVAPIKILAIAIIAYTGQIFITHAL